MRSVRKEGLPSHKTLARVQLSAVQHAEDMQGTQPLSCWAPADARNSPLPTADSVPAGHHCSLCTFTWTSFFCLDTPGLLQNGNSKRQGSQKHRLDPPHRNPCCSLGAPLTILDMQGRQTQTLRCVLLCDHQAQDHAMPQTTNNKKDSPPSKLSSLPDAQHGAQPTPRPGHFQLRAGCELLYSRPRHTGRAGPLSCPVACQPAP